MDYRGDGGHCADICTPAMAGTTKAEGVKAAICIYKEYIMRMDPFGWLYGFERLTINQAGLFMNAREIFEEVMEVVVDITGVERADVVGNRNEESTDARCLLVRYLSRLMPCVTIARLLGRTRQGVYSILSRDKGDTWMMSRNWKEIVKRLESKGF